MKPLGWLASLALAGTLANFSLPLPRGWDADYNAHLDSWTFEKYTPGRNGNDPNRFYVGAVPSDVPLDVGAFASKLQSDSKFFDAGYLYASTKTQTWSNGWLVTGLQRDATNAKDKGKPAFVAYRSDLSLLCRSGTFANVAAREEAIEACKTMKR